MGFFNGFCGSRRESQLVAADWNFSIVTVSLDHLTVFAGVTAGWYGARHSDISVAAVLLANCTPALEGVCALKSLCTEKPIRQADLQPQLL